MVPATHGADARVVALTQQIEQVLGTDKAELTVMTLSTDNVQGYFSKAVHLYRFSTLFFYMPICCAATVWSQTTVWLFRASTVPSMQPSTMPLDCVGR